MKKILICLSILTIQGCTSQKANLEKMDEAVVNLKINNGIASTLCDRLSEFAESDRVSQSDLNKLKESCSEFQANHEQALRATKQALANSEPNQFVSTAKISHDLNKAVIDDTGKLIENAKKK